MPIPSRIPRITRYRAGLLLAGLGGLIAAAALWVNIDAWVATQSRQIQAARTATARLVASTAQYAVERQVSLLEALARRVAPLDQNAPGSLELVLARELQHQALWSSVVAIDAQQSVIAYATAPARASEDCSPRAEMSLPYSMADRPFVHEVLATGRPVVGDVRVARPSMCLAVPVSVPVPAGIGTGVLTVALSLRLLDRRLRSVEPDLRIEIVDRLGQVVVDTQSPPGTVRSAVDKSEVQAVIRGESGFVRILDDTTPRLTAYVPIADRGWGVLVSEPPELAWLPLMRTRDRLRLALGAALAVAVAVAGFILRRSHNAARTRDRVRLQRQALHQAGFALAGVRTPPEVAHVVLEQGRQMLGAICGYVAVVEDRQRTIVGQFGWPDARLARIASLPLDAARPSSEALRTRRPVFLESQADMQVRYPEIYPVIAGMGIGRAAFLPLQAGDELLGVMSFDFPAPGAFDVELRHVLQSLADLAAQALQRARLYEESRALADRLGMFIDHAPVAIAMFDREMRYLAVSPRWLADYQIDHGIVGRSHYEVFPDMPAHWKDVHARALAGVPHRCEEDVFTGRNGSQDWIRWEILPWREASGRIGGVVIFSEDITVRKRAEAAVIESEARYRTLTEVVPGIVWSADARGRVMFANKAWYDFSGQSPSRLSSWTDALHPDDRGTVFRRFADARNSGSPFTAEARLRRADGRWCWHQTRALPQRDPHGEVVRWIGITTDVDDRVRTGAALVASEARLRMADRRKDEFLAMLAHELRNPLAPIRNAATVLERILPTGSREAKQAAIVHRQVWHLARLVDDLLDVSRVTQGKVRLEKQPVRLADVLDRAVEITAPLIAQQLHRLERAPIDVSWRVDGDATRLAQVFGNLLSNAAKYTPPGGWIRLATRRRDHWVDVMVIDNGAGIDPEFLDDVFDLFSQAERDAGRSQGGLGIGLALVKALVEMHDGRVTVASEGRGSGTTFTVGLPLTTSMPVAAGDAPAAVLHEAVAGPRCRVLIIDDNADAADSLAVLLEAHGHQVAVAYGGEEALRLAAEEAIDVAIVDIGLPDLDGYAVARELRRIHPAMKLVALTGYGSAEDRARTREAGFAVHLVKPAESAAVNAAITC